MDYDSKHRKGHCGEAQLTSYVYHQIKDLDKEWQNRQQAISDRYEAQFKQYIEEYNLKLDAHEEEIERVREETRRDYKM